jgi:hypothetical protein
MLVPVIGERRGAFFEILRHAVAQSSSSGSLIPRRTVLQSSITF